MMQLANNVSWNYKDITVRKLLSLTSLDDFLDLATSEELKEKMKARVAAARQRESEKSEYPAYIQDCHDKLIRKIKAQILRLHCLNVLGQKCKEWKKLRVLADSCGITNLTRTSQEKVQQLKENALQRHVNFLNGHVGINENDCDPEQKKILKNGLDALPTTDPKIIATALKQIFIAYGKSSKETKKKSEEMLADLDLITLTGLKGFKFTPRQHQPKTHIPKISARPSQPRKATRTSPGTGTDGATPRTSDQDSGSGTPKVIGGDDDESGLPSWAWYSILLATLAGLYWYIVLNVSGQSSRSSCF